MKRIVTRLFFVGKTPLAMGVGLGLGLAIGGGANVVAPAAASVVNAVVAAITTCSSASACSGGTNSSSGAGVAGTNSGSGIGVAASSKSGVAMQATAGGSNAISASNSSSSKATIKAEQAGSFSAIVAGATSGAAVSATAKTGTGVSATVTSGTGVVAYANGGTGASITSNGATAANINSYGGIGALVTNNLFGWNPVQVDQKVATPALFVGSGATSSQGHVVGLNSTVQSPVSTEAFPIATDGYDYSNGEQGFFDVDGAGNLYYTGSMNVDVRTRGGAEVAAYAPKTTESTLEDSGSAQLSAGAATIALDTTYAQSIDLSRPYRVFLTPDGDTRGLYVAQKSATSFVVRETQGGHANLAFDYRIVAAAAGHGADRIALLTPALKAKLFPLSGGRALRAASGAVRAK